MKRTLFIISGLICCSLNINAQFNSTQYDFRGVSDNTITVVGTELLGPWAKGKVVLLDRVVDDPKYYFNYDKVKNAVIFSEDTIKAFALVPDSIISFTLNNPNGPIVFDRFPSIEGAPFFQQLVKDNTGFSLYKGIVTTFIKANFTTNGITSSGHDYDEYSDKILYFILFPNKEMKQVQLKSKSIKEVFSSVPAAEEYMSRHKGSIDEKYLIEMVKALDKK